MQDGRRFQNIDEYKRLILEDKDQLARNLAEKLLAYGTGAVPSTADQPQIETIVERVRDKNYGFKDLIHEVVRASCFRVSELTCTRDYSVVPSFARQASR